MLYTSILNAEVAAQYPCFHNYSQIANKMYGKMGKVAVEVSIYIQQLGACCGYLFFIGNIVNEFICSYVGNH